MHTRTHAHTHLCTNWLEGEGSAPRLEELPADVPGPDRKSEEKGAMQEQKVSSSLTRSEIIAEKFLGREHRST